VAEDLARLFDEDVLENSYRLGLSPEGEITWTDLRDEEPVPERTEPGTSLFSRVLIGALSHLPIERYL